jgi:hypothetical protein
MRTLLLALFVLPLTALPARADLAVSIRYFKTEGTSHYHLYLYRDGGKVVRQLTSPENAHDINPIFSPDGSEIAFTREEKAGSKVMTIKPDGSGLRAFSAAPQWYQIPVKIDAYAQVGGGDNDALWQQRKGEFVIPIPDGKSELVLKDADNLKIKEPSYEAICFDALTVRDSAGAKETRVAVTGDLPENYCDLSRWHDSPFLLRNNLRVVFYWQWLGSTDGNRLGVLDLNKRNALFISENPAIAIPHGARDGFFCVTQHRYQPLPGTTKTVNCLYLEWRDADLKRTRFAKAISLFGGASIRVKDQPPLDIPKERE